MTVYIINKELYSTIFTFFFTITQVSISQIKQSSSTGLSKVFVFVLMRTRLTSPLASGMTWRTRPNTHELRGAESSTIIKMSPAAKFFKSESTFAAPEAWVGTHAPTASKTSQQDIALASIVGERMSLPC